MSATDETFQITKEDVKKQESRESRAHGGNPPAGSDASVKKSIVDHAGDRSKAEIIEERKSNLPLPDAPPGPSDFNSNDPSTVNVGSGGVPTGGNDALSEPSTGDSAVRVDPDVQKTNVQGQGVGREGGAIPNDAVTRDKKDKAGLVDTTGKDK